MRLDPAKADAIRAEAKKRGQDPDAAIARAEKSVASRDKAKPDDNGAPGKPAAATERPILVGFAPVVKVRELRAFMGLTERIADDEMLFGAFAAKYGGATDSQPAPGATATATQAATEGDKATAA